MIDRTMIYKTKDIATEVVQVNGSPSRGAHPCFHLVIILTSCWLLQHRFTRMIPGRGAVAIYPGGTYASHFWELGARGGTGLEQLQTPQW